MKEFLARSGLATILCVLAGYFLTPFLIDLGVDSSSLATTTGVISTIYALLVAFMVVEVWGQFNTISNLIAKEANHLISLWNYATYLNDTHINSRLKGVLTEYVHSVQEREVQEASKGIKSIHPSSEFQEIVTCANTVSFDDSRDAAIFPNLITTIENLSTVRSERLDASTNRLPPFLHFLQIFLSALMILSFVTLSSVNPISYFITSFVSVFMIFNIYYLVQDLDNPFDGMWNLDYSPLTEALEYIKADSH